MNCPEEHHSDSIGYWKSNKTLDSRTPVINDVLGEFSVEVVSHKWTDDRYPYNDEIYEIAKNVKHLVFRGEAETKRDLWEQQKKEILKISIKEKRR
jgi:hypothetical protein